LFVPSEVTRYIESLIRDREPALKEMELYAKEHGVPIMELVGIETMLHLLRLLKPKAILEIGTAIGYSAIRMAKELPHAKIVTIERDRSRYEIALENIKKVNLEKQITVIYGDALEVEAEVQEYGPYDCLFIDAAKGQYRRFFEIYSSHLSANGVVFSDNVLFKGFVANDNVDNKRHQTMVNKIKAYNEWLMTHPDFDTMILTVGDGIAISSKR